MNELIDFIKKWRGTAPWTIGELVEVVPTEFLPETTRWIAVRGGHVARSLGARMKDDENFERLAHLRSGWLWRLRA